MATGGGSVGIGTTAPAYKLHVEGTGTQRINVVTTDNSSTGSGIYFQVKSAGSLVSNSTLTIDNAGNLKIFTGTSTESEKVRVQSDGNMGIGTTAPAYKLEVNGSFAATTKSFVINHPTKKGKKLVYGSLESPYHGIRLTGKNKLTDGKCVVELPDYICKLARPESVSIQLTGIKCGKVLFIDEINVEQNYFVVAYEKGMFESHKNYEFFWDFTAVRSDIPELITEL